MAYTTLSRAIQMVARGSGECGDSLIDIVNRIRREWFNWYAELPLFLDVVECYRLNRFCFDCEDCRDSYLGITLPRECQTVEALWWNDWPVALESSWREFQTGIRPECDCRLQKLDMPGAFSTAADIRSGRPARLRVVAQNVADIGKTITIRGMAGHGAMVEQAFVLSTAPQLSNEAFRFITPRGGVVKETTTGRVVVAEEDGRLLGIYEPDETVPSYRRIKITGMPEECDVVNVRCARRYYPLIGENDVVETDNEPAWDAMARYLRSYRRSGKSGEELKEEQIYLATAKAHMLGDLARERGKATRSEVKFVTPTLGGRRLNRTGGRMW